jgi:hypothetical protein
MGEKSLENTEWLILVQIIVSFFLFRLKDHTLDLPQDAFYTVGCKRIFEDKITGSKSALRSGMKGHLGEGGTLLI